MRTWIALGAAALLCGACRNPDSTEDGHRHNGEALGTSGDSTSAQRGNENAGVPLGKSGPRATRAKTDGGTSGGMDAGAPMETSADAGTR